MIIIKDLIDPISEIKFRKEILGHLLYYTMYKNCILNVYSIGTKTIIEIG